MKIVELKSNFAFSVTKKVKYNYCILHLKATLLWIDNLNISNLLVINIKCNWIYLVHINKF